MNVVFSGSAGRIEGIQKKSGPSAPLALILHPHPAHGGTMLHPVVHATYKALESNGFTVLRINFRGVGHSQGKFDDGVGELVDAATALDWLQEESRQGKHNINLVAGFSFGAWIAMQLVMRRPEISNFIAISPPVNKYDFSFLSPCPAPGFIIQGDSDSIVPVEVVREFAHKLSKQQQSIHIDHKIISGADHFFRYKTHLLQAAIHEYLQTILNDPNSVASGGSDIGVNKNSNKMFLQ